MAFLAREAVLAAIFFEAVEIGLMALAALRRSQRLGVTGIKFRLDRDLHRGDRGGSCQ